MDKLIRLLELLHLASVTYKKLVLTQEIENNRIILVQLKLSTFTMSMQEYFQELDESFDRSVTI